jgi:hypothetical protein
MRVVLENSNEHLKQLRLLVFLPTGYIQTTRAALVSVRGVGSFSHYNTMQIWKVASDGSIHNVQCSQIVKMAGVTAVIAGMLAAVAGADGGPGHRGPFGVGSVPCVAESSEGYCRGPDGEGLPLGRGTVAASEQVYTDALARDD